MLTKTLKKSAELLYMEMTHARVRKDTQTGRSMGRQSVALGRMGSGSAEGQCRVQLKGGW